jgi:hypothetical protein
MDFIMTGNMIVSIKVTYGYLLAAVCPEYGHVKHHVVIHKEFH